MVFCSLMREEKGLQHLTLCPCCTLRPVTLSITHTHIHRDKEDNQETSHRTEIALCHRLSQSQWGPSYSPTHGSDTNDRYNDFTSSLQPADFFQVQYVKWTCCTNSTACVLHRHYKNHWARVRPEDTMKCCLTSVDCGQAIALLICSAHSRRRTKVT